MEGNSGNRLQSAPRGGTETRPAFGGRLRPDLWNRSNDIERFVRSHLRSETQLWVVCRLAERPNRHYTFEELAALTGAPVPEITNAIMELEVERVAVTRRQGRLLVASLSQSPTVRNMAKRLSDLCRRDEARSALLAMLTQ